MTENTPPMIPTEFLPFLEDPRPLLTVVVRKRRVWVAQKEQGSEWLVHVMTSLMIPVLSFSAIVSVLYTFWSRSSLSTKRKIHYEVHKTSVLLTKVMKRPEIYNNRKATVNAVVFWASMTFLLGVYCVGIALGLRTRLLLSGFSGKKGLSSGSQSFVHKEFEFGPEKFFITTLSALVG
ncbi:hypothetical protein LXG23DRAFT_38077 [Yarrowia lipolytica]|nr:hypothetical protein LXG23DRAFT_38077 [Yarrowia lipolytica]